ncbi:hypothetical protein GCM10027082_23340 [Comamonas humi]
MDKNTKTETSVKNHPAVRRWLRRLAWAVGGLLALWALSWAALPYLLRTQGEKIATAKLGRQVHIGAVDFKPWTLELTIRDLRIAAAQGEQPQLAVARIYADADIQSLWRLAPVLDALEVDQPVVSLAQTSPGHFDFDDVLERLKDPEPPKESKPAQFALYNIALRDGAVEFHDATVGKTHEVKGLNLGVPFVSNLESKREIKVLPQLAFQLNGSRFDSSAESTPFTDNRKTDAVLHIQQFDLAPYLGYIPASLPVKLMAGVLDADIKVAFEQTDKPAVRLSGTAKASKVRVHDARDGELLQWEALDVALADVQPLAGKVHLESVVLQSPQVSLQRDKNGQLRLLDAQGQPVATEKSKKIAAGADAESAEGQKDSKPDAKPAAAAAPAWSVQVDRVQVRDARGVWLDESVPIPARVQLDGLALDASAIAWPFQQPFPFKGEAGLSGDKGVPSDGRIAFEGQATDAMADVKVTTTKLPLQLGASYLTGVLEPGVLGQIDSQVQIHRQGADVTVQVADLSVSQVALQCKAAARCTAPRGTAVGLKGKDSLFELQKLQVKDAVIDTAKQSVKVGSVELLQPAVGVSRNKAGRWMYEEWLPKTQAAAGAKPADKPWSVELASIAVKDANVQYLDEATPRRVAFKLSALDLKVEQFAPLSTKAKPSPVKLAGRIATGRAEPGRLLFDGTVGLAPLSAAGRLNLTQVPVHAVEPYVADQLPLRLLRADASFRGQLDFAQSPKGPVVSVKGDAGLDDVRVKALAANAKKAANATEKVAAGADDTGADEQKDSKSSRSGPRGMQIAGDDLLNWKTLSLRGVEVRMEPAQRLRVKVGETALSDFYARLVVQENGKLNLQDLGNEDAPAAPADAKAADAKPAVAVAPVDTTPAPATGPIIDLGPILLSGGTVKFSDHFIKPNYSADLSELAGRIGGFSSEPAAAGQPPALADLELRGKAEGTASLEITGKLNPLVKPLALSIHGRVRDLELPPLSPYSVKYAGHGIERGKMSVDVQYDVQPNGQLTATNKLVLNQLSFGDEVKGAPASLPVKLAVALLADRDGVIDLDLPISGSLNDPQFSLGPVILKVIGNLIMKAITSPFALLSSAFGGGSEASQVAFAPGSGVLSAEAKAQLDKVAKALQDRPALQMTVVGEADLEAERDGWRKAQIDDMVLAQKRRQAIRAGGKAEAVEAVAPQEYLELLKEVYKRADIKKPRNMVGIAKDLPQAEMETLLLTSIEVPDNAMRELALARGVAVRDYLAGQGVKLERLFLGNIKTEGQDKDWKPRAELKLATR